MALDYCSVNSDNIRMPKNPTERLIERKQPTFVTSIVNEKTDEELRHLGQFTDIFEYRADMFPSLDAGYVYGQIERLHKFGKVMLTARTEDQGGKLPTDYYQDAARLSFMRRLLPIVDAVDIEIISDIAPKVTGYANELGIPVIGSQHFFNAMPSSTLMECWFNQGMELGVNYVKLATNCNGTNEFIRLRQFTQRHARNIITVSMGKNALKRRIILLNSGSLMTYGHDGKNPAAPNQPSTNDLVEAYRKTI